MLFLKADQIITQNKKRQIIKNGAIVIEKELIKDIGAEKEIFQKYKNKIKKTICIDRGVAMPGLINTHTHLAMSLLRGYADDLPLEEWWFKKIFPAEAKLTANDIYQGSLLGGLEMIKSGTTSFVDFYFFGEKIAEAAEKLGLRANIGITIMDFPTPEFANPAAALSSLPKIIEKWKNNNLINFSVAPHMIQTTSLKTYKMAKQIASRHKIILQTHLAETKSEIDFALKKYKKRPAELLIENKILDKNSIVAHACYLSAKEIKLLARKEIKVSHCPTSNMKLASGVKPLKELFDANAIIGLGTDSACSNNNLDMFEEIKIAALLHKITHLDPTIANAQMILDMATINGATCVKKEKEIGSLEIGKKADIIILDFNQPHLTPCHNPVSNIVYAANGADVDTTIVNGKILMENRKVLVVNEKLFLDSVRQKTFSNNSL